MPTSPSDGGASSVPGAAGRRRPQRLLPPPHGPAAAAASGPRRRRRRPGGGAVSQRPGTGAPRAERGAGRLLSPPVVPVGAGGGRVGAERPLPLPAGGVHRRPGELRVEPELTAAAVRLSPRAPAPGGHLPAAGEGQEVRRSGGQEGGFLEEHKPGPKAQEQWL